VSDRRFQALVGCGLGLLGLTGAGILFQQRYDIDAFVAVALAQGAIYLLALKLLWRYPNPSRAVVLVVGGAIAMRLAVVAAPPALSNDVYRYVWDGRVIAAGINPYHYIPADPHLAALRDPAIYPNVNRRSYAHTIYPPLAETIFFAVTRVSASVTAMKAAMLGFEAIGVVLMFRLLAASGQPPTRIAIYLWHPLPLWEFAGSGHVDAAIVALVALAFWLRQRQSRWLTGLALAAATLVKFYPAVIFPALWRRWDWRLPAIFAAAIIAGYLPFSGVGRDVLGFLPHYMTEEGFASGSGFYLWDLVTAALPAAGGVSDVLYLGFAALMGAGVALVVVLDHRGPEANVHGAALVAGAFMLLASPHYAWYFAWLLVFACLAPSAALLWLTLASFLLYLVTVWPQLMRGRSWLLVQSIVYMPFLALAAVDLRRRRHRWEPATHGERAHPH
jgi:alpha-1,6-mannosyltransferase